MANTTTLTNSSTTTYATSTVVTNYTTTFHVNNTITIVNNSEYYFLTNFSKTVELDQDNFIIFSILCLPIVIITVVILYHCICKKNLKKNKVVIPKDVKIDILDEINEEKSSNATTIDVKDVNDENSKVIHHVVKAVVNDIIKQVENKYYTKKKIPSVLTANKTLQRIQAKQRRTIRKRRERQLNSLVLRNMSTENKRLAHGMRIQEIFEQSKENLVKKDNYDLI